YVMVSHHWHRGASTDRQLFDVGYRPNYSRVDPWSVLGTGRTDGSAHVSRTYRQSGGHRIRWFHHGLGRGVTPGDVARWCYWLASYDVGARGTYRYCAGGAVFDAGGHGCLRCLYLFGLDSF